MGTVNRFLLLGFLLSQAACNTELGGGSGSPGENGNLGGADGSPEPPPSPSTPPPTEEPSQSPVEFSCDPGRTTKSPGMRRLTRLQYENTLRDLIERRLGEGASTAIFAELAPTTALLPEDQRAILPQDLHGSFRRLDQTVQQSHVDYWYEVGVKAGQILGREEYLGALLGECATDGDGDSDAACLTDFIRSFGKLVFRRPLSEEEVAHYESFYAPSTGIDPLGFADVIGGLLNAPQFLYIVEHGASAVSGQANTFELDAFEVAARLSYHFWGTMPDSRLFELAESGELLEAGTYEAEVERLFGDPRTRATLREFFREWMKVEDLPALDGNNSAPIFQSFAGENLPSSELRQAMMDEVVDLLDYFTWQQPGGLEQIFMTEYAFPRTEELAEIYGVAPWDGESEPPQVGPDRPGLLTRAAFLSTGTANTRPIMKGLFIRRNILCDTIPPPPENAMATPPELSPEFSTRQVVEELTEDEGSGCASCHANYINPLGFATEGFDSLGRIRSAQELFAEDGTSLGTAALDTTSIPQIVSGDMTPSTGAPDLMTMLADSGKPTACAARHYFRFTFGRWEGVASDGCALEQMRLALEETGSLSGMLRQVALTDAFRRRTFNFEVASTEGEN